MRREVAMARQTVWGVFDHPADYPNGWIARQFEIWPGEFRKTDHVKTAPTQDALHALLQEKGLPDPTSSPKSPTTSPKRRP